MISKQRKQRIIFWIMRIVTAIPLFFLIWILGNIVVRGLLRISPQLIFGVPDPLNPENWGISPAIVGTLYTMIFTFLISFPIGILAAIYLAEYSKDNVFTRAIRNAINTLAGVPSIVYGVFGFAFFILALRFPKSAIAAGLTLSLMTLPVIISASQEALLSVPKSYREGALALGATKWQSVRDHVLPNAIGGIMTGGILGLSRAGGETAPILFVYAIALSRVALNPLQPSMTLSFSIFNLSVQAADLEVSIPIAYASCLILMLIIIALNGLAIYVRNRARRRLEVQRVG